MTAVAVLNHARALRLLPLGTIISNGGGVEGTDGPLAAPSAYFRKVGEDMWRACDSTGKPYDDGHFAGHFRSEAVFLPARVAALPPRTPPIAESLLAVTLKRHAAAHVSTSGQYTETKCVCGMLCHDHPAHQTEAVIAAAINDAVLDRSLTPGGRNGG